MVKPCADCSVKSAQAPRPCAGRPLSRQFGGDRTEWFTVQRVGQAGVPLSSFLALPKVPTRDLESIHQPGCFCRSFLSSSHPSLWAGMLTLSAAAC